MMAIAVSATYRLMSGAQRLMKQSYHGRLSRIGPLVLHFGKANRTTYGASSHAVLDMTNPSFSNGRRRPHCPLHPTEGDGRPHDRSCLAPHARISTVRDQQGGARMAGTSGPRCRCSHFLMSNDAGFISRHRILSAVMLPKSDRIPRIQ